MMNHPPTFPHAIPSIHQKNPHNIPAILANLDLNRGVQAGDDLNYEEVIHANAVATALKGIQGELELRTRHTSFTLCVCTRLWRPSGNS
jgi:hypothetical protein